MLRAKKIWAGPLFAMALAMPAMAGRIPNRPVASQVYCSGIVERKAPAATGYVVSGERAADTLQFGQGDIVYLHLKSGVGKGTEFLVVRQETDPTKISWFRGEWRLRRRMGRLWADIGRVRIIGEKGNVAIARIEMSCEPMERGDRLIQFVSRTAPRLPQAKPASLRFEAGGKPAGRVVLAKGFRQELGAGDVAYMNLGTGQGMHVGEVVQFYHFSGSEQRKIYATPGTATAVEGFGHAPVSVPAGRLPREMVGEGVVLRVSGTAATVLITYSREEIDLGDYARPE